MSFRSFVTPLSRAIFALSIVMTISGIHPVFPVEAQQIPPATLIQFDLQTADSGWVLLDQHLFNTSDAGQTWQEVGPSLPVGAVVQDVELQDARLGWVLWTMIDPDGVVEFHLAHTSDGGATWASQSLTLFEAGEIASNAEKADMGWFDVQTGWISVKQNTGSNFSLGVLFTTSDGGTTWSRFSLPVADYIYFLDPRNGWAVGGPANDQVFQTRDGGASWQSVPPADLPADAQVALYPDSSSDGGSLLVTSLREGETHLRVYTLEEPSGNWLFAGDTRLESQPGSIGLSLLDAHDSVAVIPGTGSLVHVSDGDLTLVENEDGLSDSIVELDMVSPQVGWAKSIESNCVMTSSPGQETGSVSCSSTSDLLQTNDGGVTWQRLTLPSLDSGVTSFDASTSPLTVSAAPGVGNTETFIGQGFDRCEIPTLPQMQTWWNSSPYKTVNLYIGGSSRACNNGALSPSFLFQLNQQGWKFIPTWVGPQAPCTGYRSRMSSDVTTAYSQGVDEANLAVERLFTLGLTKPDKTGSVIYYDIEPYGTETGCRAAVNAFMNGWVSQIHARGSVAGVYGSTLCDTGISDFLHITNPPDVIWPARWYHNLGAGFYDPNASVWNLGSCIPNSAWANHQRIRQYEGDHNETWGGLTIDIDSNVLDGVVAVPHDYPFVSNILRAEADPTNAAAVRFTVNFSEPVTGVNKADFSLTDNGINGASIESVSGSGASYLVTVDTGSGNGTLRLNLLDDNTIHDSVGDPLGGAGNGNGNFTSGEAYTINKSPSRDSTGVFRPSNGALYLKNSNITGFADVQINYGLGGDYPVVGDWDGDGDVTIGIYRNGSFYLRNSNTIGFADSVFPFGTPGDQPVAGDWDDNGTDTIGIYRPATGQFLLRNNNSAGNPEMTFNLGIPGDVGIAGDWNGDGVDTTGVFRPSNGALYLKNKNETGFADIQINYGLPGDHPVTGDWNNDGVDTIGIYRNGQFYLRNSNTIGFADLVFTLGIPGDHPIAGDWDALP